MAAIRRSTRSRPRAAVAAQNTGRGRAKTAGLAVAHSTIQAVMDQEHRIRDFTAAREIVAPEAVGAGPQAPAVRIQEAPAFRHTPQGLASPILRAAGEAVARIIVEVIRATLAEARLRVRAVGQSHRPTELLL